MNALLCLHGIIIARPTVNPTAEGQSVDLRFGFPAQLTDEKDAKSMLTMLAQVAWEQELQRK